MGDDSVSSGRTVIFDGKGGLNDSFLSPNKHVAFTLIADLSAKICLCMWTAAPGYR